MVKQGAQFKSILIKILVLPYFEQRTKKTSFEDKPDINHVLHPLKVGCRVLDHRQRAPLILQIMLVDYLEELGADSEFLVRGHDQDLGDGDSGFWNLEIFFPRGCKGNQLLVHVDQEVVPNVVEGNEACTLDIILQQGLQLVVRADEGRVGSIHFVNFERLLGQALRLQFLNGVPLGDHPFHMHLLVEGLFTWLR